MPTTSLFDPARVSTDRRPARETEDRYEYLSWSGRPEIAAVRTCLEGWFTDYPDEAKAMLAARFQGEELTAALFELYVFTLLKTQGHFPEVIEPRPQGARKTAPDFRIRLPDGQPVLVEATTVECDPHLTKLDRDLAALKVALDRMQAPHRFSLAVRKAAETPVAFAQCRTLIEAWFRSAQFQNSKAAALRDELDSVDEEIICKDWVIEVTAYVAGPFGEPPTAGESPIVLWGTGVHFLDPVKRLKKGLKRKAEHYTVDEPLVLAVSPLGLGIDADDVESALYGPTWAFEQLDTSVTIDRNGDGLWYAPKRQPINRSIPAVLICADVHPTTVGCPDPCIYHAPETTSPMDDLLPQATHARLNGVAVAYSHGAKGHDLLGIPAGWPRG